MYKHNKKLKLNEIAISNFLNLPSISNALNSDTSSSLRSHSLNLSLSIKSRLGPPYPLAIAELLPKSLDSLKTIKNDTLIEARERLRIFSEIALEKGMSKKNASSTRWRIWMPDNLWRYYETVKKQIPLSNVSHSEFVWMLLILKETENGGNMPDERELDRKYYQDPKSNQI